MQSSDKNPPDGSIFHSRMSRLGELGRKSTVKVSMFKNSEILNVTILHDAIKSSDIDLVHRCLSQGVNVDDKTGVRETAVFAAIRHNRKDIFELLVRNGADINQKNDKDRTCLHEAIRKGRYDMVDVIIRSPGIKLDLSSKSGKTPLHLAVITRKRDIVKVLLNSGANPNVCCNNGRSPLHWAAINGDKETANLLLTAGANINEKTNHMTTPLIFASHNRGDEIVELLVFREATISGENADGDTALKLVASHGNVKLLTYMLDQMIEQVRPNLGRIVIEMTKIKDHFDKLDEISVFRYIYAKICAESSFEEEIGFEIIQILYSPIKFLNWLLKEDKELGESNLTKLLEMRFRSETQERTILRFLLRLDFCIRKCAEKHEVEYKSLMELVHKVEVAINRIFEGDHMDVSINMWKLLMPTEDHHFSEEDKLLGYARCFQEDNMINFCLNNQLKILFDKPHIATIVQKLFRTSLREAVLPEKVESNFNLKSFRIRRSLNLRSCPAAIYFLGLVTKTIAIFFTGWISISVYGNNFGTNYHVNGGNVTVYGSEIWFIVFLMGQIVHEIGELADSDYSVADYLNDEWNYFDIVEYLLCFLWLVLRFIPGQFSRARICLALAAIPQCQGLLRYLSFYKPVGELLIVLKAMFSDLSIFLGIYVLMFVGFGITFDGLFHQVDNTTFGSITESFLSLFSFTMQNFVFDGIFTTSSPAVNTIGPILQICFVVMTSIVLLNLLIALMTNSHQRISNQALREWSFSQAKTVSNLLLWKEKNGMSMLPPPFNFISIAFAAVDHYCMLQWDDGDTTNISMEKTYISLAGTVSNAILTMTVGTILRFFHRLHRLWKRMISRTNSLTAAQRLYIFLQLLFMVLWYPLYDWLYLFREYEVHLLDRMKEGRILVYNKLPANILHRLEYHQQHSEKHLSLRRKGSTRFTAADASESVKASDNESGRKPTGKFSKSIDRIQSNKFLRSPSKFYVGHNENSNSSYSMGYSLYSIGGASSKGGDNSFSPKETSRFSLSRLQPFFIASGDRTKSNRKLDDGDDDQVDDDDDDDSQHGDFSYGEGRENYGVGFRDLFQEKRADNGEALEYESSSDGDDNEEGDSANKPVLLPFEQRRLEGKVLKKPNFQKADNSNSASFFQEVEKGTFIRGNVAASNDSGDHSAFGEGKHDADMIHGEMGNVAGDEVAKWSSAGLKISEFDANASFSGYDCGNNGEGIAKLPSPRRLRLSKTRVMLETVANSSNESPAMKGFSYDPNFGSTSVMVRPPLQQKRLLRKPFASKLGKSMQSISSPSFYQSSVNMNNTSSVFNMGEALPSMMMGRTAGNTAKSSMAATPIVTSTAQRFASQFSILDHQMWMMDDDKSKIFSPDDVQDILRIFLPAWCEKNDDRPLERALSRSYSNLNDDDDRSVEASMRPTKVLRRNARMSSPSFGNRTPQFGDSMRFAFQSTQNLAIEKEKEQTLAAIKEMKAELKDIKSLFILLRQNQNLVTATAMPNGPGRQHSRSMDATNISRSSPSGGPWPSKPMSPRFDYPNTATNRNAPMIAAGSEIPSGGARSDLMNNFRCDSQSTFGYLPFVPSIDEGYAPQQDSLNKITSAGSAANIGIGGMHASTYTSMQSYPSFHIPTSMSKEDDQRQVSSSLSRSTDVSGAAAAAREPFVRPTAMERTTTGENTRGFSVQPIDVDPTVSSRQQHQMMSFQGELRHVQRDLSTLGSYMHQLQTDMRHLLRSLTSNSQLGSMDSHQQTQLSSLAQMHLVSTEDVIPHFSASMSQSFSISEFPGIYRDVGRNRMTEEVNPVKLASIKDPRVLDSLRGSESGKMSGQVFAAPFESTVSNEMLSAPVVKELLDPLDTQMSHSPSVKLHSPQHFSAAGMVRDKEITTEPDSTSKEWKDGRIVEKEVDATNLLSMSSTGLNVRIVEDEQAPEGFVTLNNLTDVRMTLTNSSDGRVRAISNAEINGVGSGEMLMGESLLRDTLMHSHALQSLSSEVDGDISDPHRDALPGSRRDSLRGFDEDAFQLETTIPTHHSTFNDNHFWMSEDANTGDENHLQSEYDGDADEEEQKEEEEGKLSLSNKLQQLVPAAALSDLKLMKDNRLSTATSLKVDNDEIEPKTQSVPESRPAYSKETSSMLNDMFTMSRTSSSDEK